jgi:hypothetical protein
MLIIACLAAIAAAKIAFSFVPEGRFWGLNQLAYYPYPITIFFVGLFLAVILMCLNKKAVNTITDLYNNIKTGLLRIPIIPRAAFFVGFLFIIFYIFRDSTNLLGDGLLRIGELQNRRLENFFNQHSAEPLDYLIHYYIYTIFLAPFKIEPILSYQLISAMAGVAYVLAALYIGKKIEGGKVAGFAFWYLIGWGGIMLFFGYVESYALAASVSVIFLGYSYTMIHGRGNELILVFLYLLAFFMHNATIVYLPAIVYLIFLKSNKLGARRLLTPVIIVLAVIAWISIGIVHRQSAGLLLTGNLSEPGYTIFSLAHLGDIINELFLLSPTFLCSIWLLNWRGEGNFRLARNYFGLAIIGGFMFLFLADPVLGMGRDWDLFALPLLGLHIGLLAGIDWGWVDGRIKAALLILLLFSTGTWICVNSTESLSVERYKNIAGLDIVRSRYAYERLGTYLLLNKNWEKAEEVYRLSLKKEPHYRTYLGLAYVQAQSGKSDSAEYNYQKALELNPDQVLALYSLCQAYIRKGDIIRARDLFERLRRVSATGIVNITDKGIRELEENLIRAEQNLGKSVDTSGIR